MSLKEYCQRFPELAESFTEISGILKGIAAMRGPDLAMEEALYKLYESANTLNSFAALKWQPSLNQAIMDFVTDHKGPVILYNNTKKLFKKYVASEQAREASDMKTALAISALISVLGCLTNFTDPDHPGYRLACGETGMIAFYLDMCERVVADTIDPSTGQVTLSETSGPVVTSIIDVLYNISREQGNSCHFAACNASARIQRFSKLSQDQVGVDIPSTSLLCLAYLVNENNNHLINADDSLIEFLIGLLKEAVTSHKRRVGGGYTKVELMEGLSHVAENDSNKAALGRHGAVRLLLKMIKSSKDEREQLSATNALWKLAFDQGNKETIQKCGGVKVLKSLHKHQSPGLRKAAAGALWEISGKQERETEVLANENENSGHLMISYQWDAQPMVVELKRRLESMGYRVWLDLDKMGGSTLDAMAQAVEDASVVLICLSQKYKVSPNCRSEAEYAYQCRKCIIPLMMEANYKPDGWLGFIIGSKFWYKFWDKDSFHASMKQLHKGLGRSGRQGEQFEPSTYKDQVDSKPPAPHSTSPNNGASGQMRISEWNTADVEKWLRQINLYEMCCEAVPYLSGQVLINLHELRKECPEYFYRSLEKDLNLKNVFNVFKFCNELSKLLG